MGLRLLGACCKFVVPQLSAGPLGNKHQRTTSRFAGFSFCATKRYLNRTLPAHNERQNDPPEDKARRAGASAKRFRQTLKGRKEHGNGGRTSH